MKRNEHQAIQIIQRSEERKSSQQYDQQGDSAQYARRGFCHRYEDVLSSLCRAR